MITLTNHGIRKVLYGNGDKPHDNTLATRGSKCGGKVNYAEDEGAREYIGAKREIENLEEKGTF